MKKNVDDMTLQEAMDYAVSKIVEQGGRCMANFRSDGFCVYGNDDGKHCAVGWLLDESNTDLMGHLGSVVALVEGRIPGIPRIISDHLDTFTDLQRFHDRRFKEDREEVARNIRAAHGIDTSGAHWQQWIDMGEQR